MMIATIGYEKSTVEDFFFALIDNRIEVLVDIRDRAQSRRKGFSKSTLSERAESDGIEYIHIRALGDPKEGRDAARSGDWDKFLKIFGSVIESDSAQEALDFVTEIARDKRICLLCYERDYRECHRKIVADKILERIDCSLNHIEVVKDGSRNSAGRRVLHSCEGAAA